MPCSAKAWPACSKCSLDCSSALLGMQPTLVQVPPGAGPPLGVFPLVDAGGVQAELRGADGGDVAAGAAADDDDVEGLGHGVSSWSGRHSSGTKIHNSRYTTSPVPPNIEQQREHQSPDPGLDAADFGNAGAHAAQPLVAAAAPQPVDGHGGSRRRGLFADEPRLGALELVFASGCHAHASLPDGPVRRRGSWRLLRSWVRCRTAAAPDPPARPSSSPGRARLRARR